MLRKLSLALASAGLFLVSTVHGGPFAASVVSYNPGVGYTTNYTNFAVVVGPPSTGTATHPMSVTPFSPASHSNQLLSLGSNGSLTVSFDPPILGQVPGKPFGLDFLIFGNSFFVESSNSTATGAVFSDACKATVSVSEDGVTFYELNRALAPPLNYLYPTDGAGNFLLPVNPAVTNFTDLTLAQIRSLYNGSAGGAGYEIAWAQDADGDSVYLTEISYVRVSVQSGQALIGGFAAVTNYDVVITEDFSHNPALDGWKTFGDTNLFVWNSTNQDLQVTWDSSQSNSYFYHPLGTILTSNDAFSLSFDIQLTDANTNADGPYQFELALGFLNLAEAENTNFLRGSGDNATNLAEFDYFPPDGEGDGPSLDSTLVDTNGDYYFPYADVPLGLGTNYHVTINHPAGTAIMTGQIVTGGQFYTDLPASSMDIFTNATIEDFRLDTVAVMSYSDVDGYGSSILAHGTVKNLQITVPPPPVTYLTGGFVSNIWQVQFSSRSNWNYTLEKSLDLQTWSPLAPMAGTGGTLMLQDTITKEQNQYYRVSAYPQ